MFAESRGTVPKTVLMIKINVVISITLNFYICYCTFIQTMFFIQLGPEEDCFYHVVTIHHNRLEINQDVIEVQMCSFHLRGFT